MVRNIHKTIAYSTIGKLTKGVTKDCEYGPKEQMEELSILWLAQEAKQVLIR